jgi:hypothetical protein
MANLALVPRPTNHHHKQSTLVRVERLNRSLLAGATHVSSVMMGPYVVGAETVMVNLVSAQQQIEIHLSRSILVLDALQWKFLLDFCTRVLYWIMALSCVGGQTLTDNWVSGQQHPKTAHNSLTWVQV